MISIFSIFPMQRVTRLDKKYVLGLLMDILHLNAPEHDLILCQHVMGRGSPT